MKILIITDYFHPSSAVSVHRVSSWVRYWPQYGCKIHVISTQKSMSMGSKFEIDSVFLHATMKNPKNTIDDSQVRVQSSLSTNYLKIIKYIHRKLKQKVFCSFLEPRIFQYWRLCNKAAQVCQKYQIDAVVSSSPTFVTHLIASKLKRKLPKLVWLADYRDLWSGYPITPGLSLIAGVEKRYEKTILNVADIITTVSQPLAEYLTKLHQKSVQVIPNGIEMDDVVDRINRINSLSLSNNKQSRPVCILYTGSVPLGLYDPVPLFSAVSRLIQQKILSEKDIRIVFVGNNDGLDRKAIKKFRLFNVVQILEPVSRADALLMQEKADALLFLGAQKNGGQAINGVVSGKIFEYFTSGTKILAIGTTKNMTVGNMIEKCGVGICLGNDVEAIMRELLLLVREGKQPVTCRQSCIDKFRRDKLAKKMFLLLQEELH